MYRKKRFSVVVTLSLFLLAATTSLADQKIHSRLIFGGSRALGNDFSLSGRLMIPNIRKDTTTLAAVGLRYRWEKSWIEILAGEFMPPNSSHAHIFGVRASLQKYRVHTIGELRYSTNRMLYSFTQISTPVRIKGILIGKIGIQSENMFRFTDKPHSLGIGPHLIIPLSERMKFLATYQFGIHKRDPDVAKIFALMSF